MRTTYLFLFLLLTAPVFGQDLECNSCDTSFYYRKKPFGELEKLYPTRIICYFAKAGNKTDQKCFETTWKEGVQNGVEKRFLYEDTIYLLNLWGKPFKSHASDFRKNVFGAKVQNRPLEYKGYYRNGQKHGLWTYYNHEGLPDGKNM